jgi:type VI protein secretion system component VasF
MITTPQEAAQLVDYPNPSRYQELHDFVLTASARTLQLFVHTIRTNTTDAKEWRYRADIALKIRFAEDAEKSAEKLVTQTDKLAEQIGKLREISDAHKQIAENAAKSVDELNKQTSRLIEVANAQKQLQEDAAKQGDRLIKLTWVLAGVSAGLLVFAIVQTAIMLKQDARANTQRIEAGQHQQGASTNK